MSKFLATQARSTSGIFRSLRSRIVSVGDWMMKAQSSQMGTDWSTGVTLISAPEIERLTVLDRDHPVRQLPPKGVGEVRVAVARDHQRRCRADSVRRKSRSKWSW